MKLSGKKNIFVFVLATLIVATVVVLASSCSQKGGGDSKTGTQSNTRKPTQAQPKVQAQARVPAYYDKAPSRSELKPTLPPERFLGKTREAYQAVAEMPETIAQMPCYCHCDESIGHKSLQSCFVDEHAGSCAVCVQEALLAYRLQKEQRLSAPEIRERIINLYSKQ